MATDVINFFLNEVDEEVPVVVKSKRTGSDWYDPKKQKKMGWRNIGVQFVPKSETESPNPRFGLNAMVNAVWRGVHRYAEKELKLPTEEAADWAKFDGINLLLNFSNPDNKKLRSYITVPGTGKKLSEYDPQSELTKAWEFSKEIIQKVGDTEEIANYTEENKDAFSKWILLILKDALKQKGLGSVESVASEALNTVIFGMAHQMATNAIFSLIQYEVLKRNNLFQGDEQESFFNYAKKDLEKVIEKMSLNLPTSTLDKLIGDIFGKAKEALLSAGFDKEDAEDIASQFVTTMNDNDFFQAVGNNIASQKAFEDLRSKISSDLENNSQVLDTIQNRLVDKEVKIIFKKAVGHRGSEITKPKELERNIDVAIGKIGSKKESLVSFKSFVEGNQ
jgi:hypothetical protein